MDVGAVGKIEGGEDGMVDLVGRPPADVAAAQCPCRLSTAAAPRSTDHHRRGPLPRHQDPRPPRHLAPRSPPACLNQLRYDLRKLKGPAPSVLPQTPLRPARQQPFPPPPRPPTPAFVSILVACWRARPPRRTRR